VRQAGRYRGSRRAGGRQPAVTVRSKPMPRWPMPWPPTGSSCHPMPPTLAIWRWRTLTRYIL